MPHTRQHARRTLVALAVGGILIASSARGTFDDDSPRGPQDALAQGGSQPATPDRRSNPDDEPECIVSLLAGGQISGRLVAESDTSVSVRIGSIVSTIPLEEVESVVLVEAVLDRYRRMRKAIGQDAEQLLLLVEWLISERRYALALREVENVLLLEPLNARAREHKRLLEEQIRLASSAREDAPKDAPPAIPGGVEDRPFPLLSPEQINLIRVYEVDLANPPKMLVQRETVDKILSYYAEHDAVPKTPEGRDALQRRRADQILDLLFQLRARELYGEVRVEEDPESMRRFRVDVHNDWLARGCATSRCHGGQSAGRLYLAGTRPRADDTVYTNFLILDRFRTKDGRPLIDYDEPGKSLLLELALPREISTYPHPPINELGRERPYTPPIRSRDDARFRKTVAWIRSMYAPHPDYPIAYTPPVPAGLDQASPREPGRPR